MHPSVPPSFNHHDYKINTSHATEYKKLQTKHEQKLTYCLRIITYRLCLDTGSYKLNAHKTSQERGTFGLALNCNKHSCVLIERISALELTRFAEMSFQINVETPYHNGGVDGLITLTTQVRLPAGDLGAA